MITVEQAEQIILGRLNNYGFETVVIAEAPGRVLAEDIRADRDLPPFNRVTMDGIAIAHRDIVDGIDSFIIKGTQAAGHEPINLNNPGECIEIMTGAALPPAADTVIRYEDIEIANGKAILIDSATVKGQNIHQKGNDKKRGDILATAGQLITPAIISLAVSVGKFQLIVKKLPKVLIISSGDELVDVCDTPNAYQIRRSNNYTIQAALKQHGLETSMLHIPDDFTITKQKIQESFECYDVLLLSGGVSMGKFDHIPKALSDSGIDKLFHKVRQRPGKPFWFGRGNNGKLVFAFPGNPVATFMCLHRYFLPWLNKTLGLAHDPEIYAILDRDFTFELPLQYFLQVKLSYSKTGHIIATPVEGNGSGDFANLADADAFMELPLAVNEFKKGEAFRIYKF